MLIVPDVHGRSFWKEPIKNYPNDEVIFLGDYVDPYYNEGIDQDTAIDILLEIVDLKKNEPDRINLLLGNHDLPYIASDHYKDLTLISRFDWENKNKIRDIFSDIIDSLSFGLIKDNYLFSHAGIHPGWLKRHPEFLGESVEDIVDNINKSPWNVKSLLECSYFRGGEYSSGSPIWSDVREWINLKDADYLPITQIFGHTQLMDGFIYDDPISNFKDIDCKHVIRINNNNLEIL